jgi:mannose-6-phosphate isomerase
VIVLLLRNVVQPNDWGPVDGLARLLGSAPTGGHEAELWVGTHERGPSTVIAHDPAMTGRKLAEVVGDLPFLLKVLAIGQALSIQAHPSIDEAAAGFAREEEAGLPVDAPHRNYRDAGAKPEVLVALEPTWVLCGFRSADEAADLIHALGASELGPLVDRLRGGGPDALLDALGWLLRLGPEDRHVVSRAASAAATCADPASRTDPLSWVGRLAQQHPGDPMCVAPLLLELLELAPGEAVHLPAGNLHVYLEGAGVELMSTSDNVLRGGLTSKHVDVDELLHVLRREAGVPPRPVRRVDGALTVYDCGEPTFGLVRVELGDEPVELAPRRQSLFLPVGGEARLAGDEGGLNVGRGDAAYAPAGEAIVASGHGSLWWATTGDGLPG